MVEVGLFTFYVTILTYMNNENSTQVNNILEHIIFTINNYLIESTDFLDLMIQMDLILMVFDAFEKYRNE